MQKHEVETEKSIPRATHEMNDSEIGEVERELRELAEIVLETYVEQAKERTRGSKTP